MAVSALTAEHLARWSALFDSQRAPGNPFSAPAWVLSWYQLYTREDRRHLLWVTVGDRLVGVCPFYEQSVGPRGRGPGLRRLLVGAGRQTPLELPGVLSAQGHERDVVRAVVEHTLAASSHWSELTLDRAHAPFEPEWVYDSGRATAFQRHQLTRTCVMLPLEQTWEDTRASLRRNVKESIRRSHNRLAKDGRPWSVRLLEGAEVDVAAVDRLLALHSARAANDVGGVQHPDVYADPARRALVRAVVPALAVDERATIAELVLDGDVVASQLVLRAPGCTYLHSSGFRTSQWHLSPLMAVQVAAVQDAVKRGHSWVNFSPGPNMAKLRWSRTLHDHHDVAFGAGGGWLAARYAAFSMVSDVRQLQNAIAMARSNSRGARA
jgi:CelD/BcsL family acetyltransferase involved in cellulose biosynthesis